MSTVSDEPQSAEPTRPHDALGIFNDLREALFRYYDTPFGVDDDSVMEERRRLFNTDQGAWRHPLFELRPQYTSSGMSVEESFAEALAGSGAEAEAAAFARFALPDGVSSLYSHQHDALVAACHDQKDFVVTAGTGSGKTEAFLLPVLADLVRESAHWTGTRAPQRPWWNGGDYLPSRSGEPGHPKAVRALILYPTNALADDQLVRLRRALDSDGARTWLDAHRGGHRFYFGRYTGATPVPGSSDNKAAVNRLREYLAAVHQRQQRADAGIHDFIPRLGGAEMHSRWDMQHAAPDILVTNYSMLNIMLLRPQEDRIFADTRRWLESDPDARFTLILDELHMYRGTAGTEVAYLLRNLRHRLGLDRTPEKFRVLAASASLEAGRDDAFLDQFFALPSSRRRIIPGTPVLPRHGSTDLSPHAAVLAASATRGLTGAQAQGIVQATGIANAVPHVLSPGGKPRALSAPDLAAALFPRTEDERLRTEALHGALRALGEAGGAELPKLRAHLFFRNIPGVWACSDPACPDIAVEGDGTRRVGRLFAEPASRCTCGARVLELLYCQTCGDLMLGGYAAPGDMRRQGGKSFSGGLHTDYPELDLLPDDASGRPTAANYIVYWPRTGSLGVESPDWSASNPGSGPTVTFEFRRSAYHPGTGRLHNQDSGNTGWSFHITVPEGKESGQSSLDPSALSPFPTRCPACGDDWEIKRDRDGHWLQLDNMRRLRAPVRRMRTGFNKVNQVLATEVLGHMPDKERKAIAFSDSRDDASELASEMALRHYQDLLRLLTAQAVGEQGDPFADLQLVKAFYAKEEVDREEVKRALARLRSRDANGGFSKLKSILTDDIDAEPELLPELERQFAALPSLDSLAGDLEGSLLKRGMNPGGPAASLQETEAAQRWTALYNWDRDRESVADTEAQQHLLAQIRERLRKEFVDGLFSSAGRDFESLGLGWLCLRDDRLPLAVPAGSDTGVARASLRILGMLRRFNGQRAGLSKPPVPLKRFWEEVARQEGTDIDTVQDRVLGIWGSAVVEYVVNPELVGLRQGEGLVWTCGNCRREHLHPGAGLCTKCQKQLPATPVQFTGVLDDDYYAWKAAHGTGSFPLRTAELTGQTNRLEAQRRQSLFQDVFLDEDDVEEADGLELLSVTTTMEAGVDVGPLNAVLMANMPPTRFNYQQRVGRAGRRNSPVAVALTACRGRSHDEHYFARPEAITNDPTPRPYLALGMPNIFKRVLLGEVLRQAFATVAQQRDDKDPSLTSNVHGQFGLAADWQQHRAAVLRWIAEHPERILAASAALQSHTPDPVASLDPVSCIADLLDDVDRAAESPVGHAELSQRLAEAGLLPMFGFPTRSRSLYRTLPTASFPWPPPDAISRDLAVALSKFAPGSETPQDGRMIRSTGVVVLTPGYRGVRGAEEPFGPEQRVAMCRICSHVEPLANEADAAPACPACGAGGKHYQTVPFREPGGFRADHNARDYDGTREWGSGSTSTRTAADLTTDAPRIHRDTDDWLVAHAGSGKRYLVNSNGGKLFRFRRDTRSPWRGYWHVSNPRTEADLETALGATQHTDMLFLGAKSALDPARGLRFDISNSLQQDGFADAYHGRRASWYSLAALLRRAAAPYLDVQPEELLSGIHGSPAPVSAPVMAYLADSLDNGAGFSTHLGSPEQIDDFLAAVDDYTARLAVDPRHADTCSSSCYTCLRDYSNMRLHPLFDWRLARDLVDALRGRELAVDVAKHTSLLASWAEEDPSVRLLKADAGSALLCESDFSGIPVAVCVKHPLEYAGEGGEAPRLRALRQDVLVQEPDAKLAFVDAYCLDRTPAAVIDQVTQFAEEA